MLRGVSLLALAAAVTALAPAASRPVVIGQEQDVHGFDVALACCDDAYATAQIAPVIRGAFVVDDRLRHLPDLVVAAKATATTLSYTIRRNASWYWGGRRLPVTYADFAYTWRQMVDPANPVVSRGGYDDITGYTHDGPRQITFRLRSPYPAWQDLFARVYPAAALAGTSFATAWSSCICGSDGRPVADGPYYLASHTPGEGSTLRANPYWYGHPPGVKTIAFSVEPSVSAEIRAMQSRQLDVIAPSLSYELLQLQSSKGISGTQAAAPDQNVIAFRLGPQGQPLLRAPWLRRAIMLALDRHALVQVAYGPSAGGLLQLDNLLVPQAAVGYRGDFDRWNHDPKRALALLARHCSGGPSAVSGANTAVWTWAGYPARFRYAWPAGDPAQTALEAVVKAELLSVGIAIVDDPRPGPPAGADFDLEALTLPAATPAAWTCGGAADVTGFCDRRVTTLLRAAAGEVDPARRRSDLERADRRLALDVPAIPLVARPVPLFRRSTLRGVRSSPLPGGFTWNAQDWRWTR